MEETEYIESPNTKPRDIQLAFTQITFCPKNLLLDVFLCEFHDLPILSHYCQSCFPNSRSFSAQQSWVDIPHCLNDHCSDDLTPLLDSKSTSNRKIFYIRQPSPRETK